MKETKVGTCQCQVCLRQNMMYTLREGVDYRGTDLHEMSDAPDWPPRVRRERPGEDGYLQAWESSLSEPLQEGRRCVSRLVFSLSDLL